MGEKKPYLAVLLVQSIYGGMFMLSKAAFNGGMNNYVFVFYRQAAATLFLAPFAFYFEWYNSIQFPMFFFLFLFLVWSSWSLLIKMLKLSWPLFNLELIL